MIFAHPVLRFLAMLMFGVSLFGCVTSSPVDLHPRSSVVLDAVPQYVLKPCSRSSPPSVESVWLPTTDDITRMEANFHKLLRLKSTGCCLQGMRIRSLQEYDLLYVGIVSQGRHLIYVATAGDWCDGGIGSWGVVYNPENGQFSELHVNGVA